MESVSVITTSCIHPIIIGGLGRSGSTLLQAILAEHPDVAMFRGEVAWWTLFDNLPTGIDLCKSSQLLDTLYRKLLNEKHVKMFYPNLTLEHLKREIGDKAPLQFGDVLRSLFKAIASQQNKPRWGFKTVDNELLADTIFAAWPDAYMIQIIRDPRDVLVSRRSLPSRSWWPFSSAIWRGWRWNQSTNQARRNQKRYPDAYYYLRFEDFINDPELETRKLCDFLQLDFHPEMLVSFGKSTWRWRGHNSQFDDVAGSTEPISRKPLGRHIENLSPIDVGVTNRISKELMSDLGYSFDTVSVDFSHRIAVWFHIVLEMPVLGFLWYVAKPVVQKAIHFFDQIRTAQPMNRRSENC